MSYNLQLTIDGDSGFCFGVVYAIDMAEEILAEQGYLYCLGDIVHNDEEVERLKAKGMQTENIPKKARHELAAELQNLIQQHKDIWVLRNREGGLNDSASKLEEVLNYLNE